MKETSRAFAELVRKSREGDVDAFESLYRESIRSVTAVCRKYLKKEQDVEDAVQDTYLASYQQLNKLKEPEKFLSWANQIAAYKCIDEVKRQIKKRGMEEFRPVSPEEDMESMDDLAADSYRAEFDPEEKVDGDTVVMLVQGLLSNLNVLQRAATVLWSEGKSYQEIADALDIPVGTVRSSLHYSKKKMKTAVEELEEKENIRLHGMSGLGGFLYLMDHCDPSSVLSYAAVRPELEAADSAQKLARKAWLKRILGMVAVLCVGFAGLLGYKTYSARLRRLLSLRRR